MPVYTYTTIDDPLATKGTTAEDINNAGQIVGSYDNGSGQHGFLYSNGVFTTLDDPLATNGTEALGINDLGQIVGDYSDATGVHGFLYSGGNYTTLDDPSTPFNTRAAGINDLGQIVGFYLAGTPPSFHGFLYSGGKYTTLDDPSAVSTSPFRINNAGQIVGVPGQLAIPLFPWLSLQRRHLHSYQ